MRFKSMLPALAAAVLVASSALANCPELSSQSRIQALEGRIESLHSRLESLDVQLGAFDVERRQALDEVRISIEQVVHDGSLSQSEIDAAVAAAIARADDRARAVAESAAPAQLEARSVRSQLGVLVQQLHTLARSSKPASNHS